VAAKKQRKKRMQLPFDAELELAYWLQDCKVAL